MPSQPVAPWIEQVLLDIFRTCTYPTSEGDELHDILKAKLILSKAIAAYAPKPAVEKLVEVWNETNTSFKANLLDWYPKLHEALVALAAYEKGTR